MVKKLFEINETATFAWDPTQAILATGTLSGTLDDSFSNTSILRLYDHKSTVLGQVDNSSRSFIKRFNKLAWSRNGVIAGGLEDGSLSLWQAQAIIDKSENALLLNSLIHTGPINSLDTKGHLLASASNEVYIWDLNKQEPFVATKQVVNHLSWNGQVQHIIAMGMSNQIVIWDLRHKRQVKVLPIQAPTSVVWHPDQTTQLATCSDNGISLWDLRHTQVPEKTMPGHAGGTLDLSWCRQDSDLLLSCGKDGKTTIWNPNSGEALGEVAQHLNWAFKTSWSPCQPDLLASASYDGKIQVYSLQQTESIADDPFSAALNPPKTFKQPPKWFRRPIGATFAFGGKLIMFHARKVKSVTVVTEKDVVHRATQLENALTGQHPLDTLIDKYEEKNDDSWKVIRALLVQENQRDHLIHYLGLERDKIASEIDKILGDKKPLDSILDEKKDSKEAQPVAIDPDFFTQVQERKQEPLKLCTQNKDDIDGLIARTVALGDFESAVDLCLHQDRVSDALMFSIYGGKDLLEKTQQSYFQRTTNRPYISLLKSLMTDDLGHLVKSVSLDDWKSTLIALCSYATPEEFSPLCNLLGQRLEAASMLAECLLCYLSSKSLENVCRIWIANFKYNTEMDLQRIIGRITIFMKIIGFSDKDLLKETSLPSYPLSPLYELYIQYAHFLASQGKLSCSLYYLNRIPHGYNSIQLAFLHDRVYHATSSNDATNIRHIQRPEIPYEIKPIKVIQTPVQQYKPVRSSPLISNNYNTAYTPVVAAAHSPLIPNSYTSTSSTTYSYSTNNFSPRPKNSHIATKSPLTPKINHIQATHNYSPTVSYTPSNNGYTTYSQNYTTSTPQNNNYSQQQQQPSHFTSYQSNGGYQATSHSPSLNKTSTQAYNNYSAATSHYQQPSPPVTFYHQSYSPKIPAPPPVVDISPVTETTPRPTAFHDPPPMLISKTPKRNTTPVKRVMSPFPNQTLQSNYSPAGSPRPTNALPPPPMNAAAPAPLSRQKTPTYDYYQQNTRMQ